MFLINPFWAAAAPVVFSAWDPATVPSGSTVLSSGNTVATITASTNGIAGTQGRSRSEGPRSFTVTISGPDHWLVGIGTTAAFYPNSSFYPGFNLAGFAYYSADGSKFTGNSGSAYGATFTSGDVIGVLLAADGKVTFYKNGSSQGVAFDLAALGFSSTTLFYPMFGAGTAAAGARVGTIDTSAVLGGATAWG